MIVLGSHMLNAYYVISLITHKLSISKYHWYFLENCGNDQAKKVFKTYPLIEEAGVLIWEFAIVLDLFLRDGDYSL